jgi:hypothetical protein
MMDSDPTLAKANFRVGLLLYACAQFFVLTIVAMFLYPGGAKYHLAAEGYLFLQNFFSDLGATRTYSGKPNMLCASLFIVALSFLGLAMIVGSPVWRAWRSRVPSETAQPGMAPFPPLQNTSWGIAAQIFAALSGLCYLGVAVTPWNYFLETHNNFVKGAFSLLLGLVVCLVFGQFSERDTTLYLLANCAYLILLAGYVYLLFAGPSLQTQNGLAVQVATQKIIIYVSILHLAGQAVGRRRAILLR